MKDRGIVLVANMGDDSITAYENETYREVFRVLLMPAGTKLINVNHFARGPMVGPGYLYHRPDENQLLVVNIYDDSLSIIDLNSREVINTIFAGSHPNQIKVLEYKNRAYVTNYDSDSVSVIDLQIQEIIGQIPCGIMPQSMVLDQRNKRLYIVNTGSEYISVIDALSMDKLDCLRVGGYPVDMCCDNAGQRLYIIVQSHERQENNCLMEYNIHSGKRCKYVKLGTMPVNLLYHESMGRIYTVDAVDNRLTIIDSDSFAVQRIVELGRMPVSQSLGSNGEYLHVVCMIDNCLYKVDLNTGLVTRTVSTGVEPASVLAMG